LRNDGKQLSRMPLVGQDDAMSDYAKIDSVLMPWAQARGLHVYTGHSRNVVRSLTIYVWAGARHESTGHIWIDPPNELGLVGVHAAHAGYRFDDAVTPAQLAAALDAAEAQLRARYADAF
jgi:hypothetical protein